MPLIAMQLEQRVNVLEGELNIRGGKLLALRVFRDLAQRFDNFMRNQIIRLL
jgi:hypothetical protein